MAVFATLSVVAFLLLLLLLGMAVDVLVTQGDLQVSSQEAYEQTRPWAGGAIRRDRLYFYERRGILPLAVRWDGTLGGDLLRWAYQQPALGFLRNSQTALMGLILLALAVAGVECLCLAGLRRCAAGAALDVATRLRGELREQTFRMGGADAVGRAGADPVQLFTDSVDTVRRTLVQWWVARPRSELLLAGLLLLAMWLQFWIALSAILLSALLFSLGTWLRGLAQRNQKLAADRAEKQMAALVEGIKQARLVNGYLLEDTPGAPYGESMQRYLDEARDLQKRSATGGPLLRFAILSGVAVVLGLVSVNLLAEPPRTSLSEAAVLATALAAAYIPLKRLAELQAAGGAAERAAAAIFAYLDREPKVQQHASPTNVERLAGSLQLERVTLRDAAGKPVLNELSLEIPAGRRVAIFSAEEDAPLALACLLPRFVDPAAGRVLFDGHDIRLVSFRSLRRQVALVLQDGLLFSATVGENISCGDPAVGIDRIREVAKRACADEVIQKLPQGFDTTVGEHGVWIDPGERLLIGLARALVRDPSVLVVEEPREDLPPETSKLLQDALGANAAGRTLVTLFPSLASLRAADHILLLSEGRLHSQGTHAQLVQTDDLYRHLLYVEFNVYRHHLKSPAQAG